MTYRPRTDLHLGDLLVDYDRERLDVITEAFSVDGVCDYRPGAGAALADAAWSKIEEGGSMFLPTDDSALDPFFAPFVKAAGGKNCYAAITTLNGPPTPVHVDNWTDEGNRDDRWTALFIYRRGELQGGEYALVDHRLAFDLSDGDLLLSRTDIRHGNLPRTGTGDRLAVLLCIDRKA